MRITGVLKRKVRAWASMPRDIRRISRLVNDPSLSRSYYPAEERKSKLDVYADLLAWWLRHREVNTYYYFYGLDRKHGADPGDYLPYNQFRNIRDRLNQRSSGSSGYNYVCLLRDKFVFSQFVSSLGFPVPKNLALCNRDSVTWLDRRGNLPLESLLEGHGSDIDVFCKKLKGMGGQGVFPLRVTGGRLFKDDQEITLDDLKAKLNGEYLLQEPIRQHPSLSALHPQSVNSIRLVTFNNTGKVQPLWAALKIGSAGSRVDNVACGGLAVKIDIKSGCLEGNGMFLPGQGGSTDRHPDTGIPFADFEIPYFREAVQCAMDVHRRMYGIHSIGWDIAITEAGPVIIEGNDDWAGHFAMAFVPKFRSTFLEMCNSAGAGPRLGQ